MTSETRPADRGHDYEYEEPPSDRLVCKICQLPCREAQMSECCGHVFCERDLESMKAAKTIEYACPICRIKPFNTYPNRAINREIKELRVYCPYKSDGCNWIGKVMNVDEHLKGQIPCSKCKQPVDHTTIATHITNKCPCYCQYCKMTAKKEVISNEHQEKCHKFPVPCPNDCGKNITRSNLGEHKKTCPLEIIKCNECGAEMARKDEEEHNKEFMTKHFSVISTRLQNAHDDAVNTMLANVQVLVNHAFDHVQAQILDLNAAINANHNENHIQIVNWLNVTLRCASIVAILLGLLFGLACEPTEVDIKLEGNNEQFQQTSSHRDVLFARQLAVLNEKLDGVGGQVAAIVHAQTIAYSKLENMEQHLESSEGQQFSSVSKNLDDLPLNARIAPVILKLSRFSDRLKHKETWHSSPFLAFWKGYQMCLVVFLAGIGNGKGTHLSVFLKVMKGPYDDELQQSGHWPARGIFSIEVLDQLSDNDHHFGYVLFDGADNDVVNRVVDSDIAPIGLGIPKFISHAICQQNNTKYIKNDTLHFRISYADENQHYHTAPVIINAYNISKKIKHRQGWFSNPFFAFWKGYQMCLRVDVTGGNDEVTHISVYLHVMKGPYDDELQQSGHWPVRGTFTIELLNQSTNNAHHITYLLFDDADINIRNRVVDGVVARDGWGRSKFISIDTLYHQNNDTYSDYLHFRISYMDTYQHYVVAPVILKMSNFDEKMKQKEKWFSDPFFAFWKGYQLCLAVYVAGSGIGEGSHISAYLFLMKGPYDDDLEQSGHWPLIGTFTIELLNQLSDHDHHVTYVLYTDLDDNSNVKKRVVDDNIAQNGFGEPQFVSHNMIYNRTGVKYFKNDTLYFRVSYLDTNRQYPTAPVIVKMYNLAEKVRNKDSWFSSPFLAFWKGYQMCLLVKVTDNDLSGDIYVYLHLMKGPYDDELEQSGHWPVRGTFRIELLNQLSDNDHHAIYISYGITDYIVGRRVLVGHISPIASGSRLISHDILLNENNNKYVANDALYFRISYLGGNQQHYYISPVILKMSNFAERMEHRERWLSSPFFTFWRGYQMCLSVNVVGYISEEATYLSVFVYLMNGPYDDELEQSGHWPVRGTLTIELLNQLSDNSHHGVNLSYDNANSAIRSRVVGGDIALFSLGKEQFISHDILLYSNNTKYLANNSLCFKVSYKKQH